MPYPDGGASRFQTQKVRFESQTLISDLSPNSRATQKAFDQSPMDSNRVGLFFSPTKELNMDIAKSCKEVFAKQFPICYEALGGEADWVI